MQQPSEQATGPLWSLAGARTAPSIMHVPPPCRRLCGGVCVSRDSTASDWERGRWRCDGGCEHRRSGTEAADVDGDRCCRRRTCLTSGGAVAAEAGADVSSSARATPARPRVGPEAAGASREAWSAPSGPRGWDVLLPPEATARATLRSTSYIPPRHFCAAVELNGSTERHRNSRPAFPSVSPAWNERYAWPCCRSLALACTSTW